MRLVQNLALFGLWGGTALLFWGMTTNNTVVLIVGAGLGIMVGVPAAYLNFAMQGQSLKIPRLPFKLPQFAPKPVEDETPAEQTPELVTPQPRVVIEQEEAVSIPVRVVAPEPAPEPAPLPEPEGVLEPEPEAELVGMTHAEREELVKGVNSSTDVDELILHAAHEDSLVRLYAVQRLGDLGDQRAGDTLFEALDDDEKVVRRAARIAIHKVGLRAPEE